jgi:hypothetical protein
MLDPLPVEEEVSVVLAGPFERADFEPQKLVARGILTEDEKARTLALAKLRSPGMGFTVDGITLYVAHRKLNIETHDVSRSDRLRDMVLGILHHATGTPNQACGINYEFFFALPHEQACEQVISRQASVHQQWSGILEHPTVRELIVSGQRWGKFPGENNVSIRPWKRKEHGLMVAVNYHFPMPQDHAGQELPKLAAEFIEKEWSPALGFAHRAVRHIFTDGGLNAS